MRLHKAPRNIGSTSRLLKLTPGVTGFEARYINDGFARIFAGTGIVGDCHRRAYSRHPASRSRLRAFGAWNFNRLSRTTAAWSVAGTGAVHGDCADSPRRSLRATTPETLTND
jgi:hypothetical protein